MAEDVALVSPLARIGFGWHDGKLLRQESNPRDEYPAVTGRGPVYLNIVWHQHQPLYVDPTKDQLQGPWVRVHSTKDYYDMTAMLRTYPKVHVNVNLTTSLLLQLRDRTLTRTQDRSM